MNGHELSAPVRLLDLVWAETNQATRHFWERFNHSMAAALRLAVGAGMVFAEDDYALILGRYRTGRWIGDDEWVYSLAVEVENLSAVSTFEKARGRTPIIADTLISGSYASEFSHGAPSRKTGRLTVGTYFVWRGQRAKVTSWAADQSHVVACTYKKTDRYEHKVDKRFRISRADVLAERRERRALAAGGAR